MQNVMGPMIARAQNEGGKARLRSVVARLDRMLLLGSVAFATLIWLVGPFAARFIFRVVPGNARVVLFLLSLNLVAYAATLAQSYGLTALNRADTTFYANAIGVCVQAVACFFLVRAFHVPGAAGAMLVGSVVVLAVRGLFFRREMRAV
jgi:O-antigen/teichoic acid export membrane protein